MAINELHGPARPKPAPRPGPTPLRDHGGLLAGLLGAGGALGVYAGARTAQGIYNLVSLMQLAAA
jgi:hypothetical protein